MKRRNKPSRPCIEGPYDEKIIQNTIEKVGCAPAYLKANNSTRQCIETDYLAFIDELMEKDHPPPCDAIESINEWHKRSKIRICNDKNDTDCARSKNTVLFINIHFMDDIFKEIVYTKVYSVESLIANIGGYIGK